MRSSTANRVIDPETGIIRWVSEIPLDPGDPEIINYSTKMCDSGVYFPMGCYDSNGGAGLTREAARWAAIGEAVERYCSSVFFPDEFLLGTYEEVRRHGRAVDPRTFALFHPKQRDSVRYAWVDDDPRLCWTWGYSLTAREPTLIPASLVYIPYYPFRQAEGEVTIAPGVSTGQATARDPSSAVLSGLYEIIERDAFMISWLNRLPLTRLDIESNPAVRDIFRSRFERPDLEY